MSLDFYGLRAAKRLVKKQKETVKGQLDPWSKGYRYACGEIAAAIDAEMKRLKDTAADQAEKAAGDDANPAP